MRTFQINQEEFLAGVWLKGIFPSIPLVYCWRLIRILGKCIRVKPLVSGVIFVHSQKYRKFQIKQWIARIRQGRVIYKRFQIIFGRIALKKKFQIFFSLWKIYWFVSTPWKVWWWMTKIYLDRIFIDFFDIVRTEL